MGKFSLAEAMKLDVSKLDTAETQQINIDLIDPNPENFFHVEEDVTDLMESIQLNGLMQPLVVVPAEGDRYRLIAGHRRRKALLNLAESDPEKWRAAPCIVQHPASPEMEMLMLIQTNTEARELGWKEKSTAADKVEKILAKLQQEQGITLPGKMRTRVAQIIKTSESQLARAKFIKEHLIPAAKKMRLNDNVSYKMAHLPKEDQQALCEHYKDRKWCLDGPAIKKYQENVKAGRDPFAKSKEKKYCYYATNTPCTMTCPVDNRNQCCYSCKKRFNCSSVCAEAEKRNDAVKKSVQYAIGQRLKELSEQHGYSADAICQALSYDPDYSDLIFAGQFSINFFNFPDFCRRFNISADWLLGLTDEDKPAAAPAAPDGWNLAENVKPEDGQLCEVLVTDGIDPGTGKKVCDIWAARWTGNGFRSALSGTQTRKREIAWRPLPEPLEGYSFSIIKEEG